MPTFCAVYGGSGAPYNKAFHQALDRAAAPWTTAWDEPKYLPEFLMLHPEKQQDAES